MGKDEFDYVIVGAGSAGCTLAARISEDPEVSVLLLEAGGWDRDPWLHIPLGWPRQLVKREHDWMYGTEPEPALGNRSIPCWRGKVIGGSSSINAMAYVRGHRADYQRWAQSVSPGWSYEKVLPYFKKQESWAGGGSAYRGSDGPLGVRLSKFNDPLVDAMFEAGLEAGYSATDDYNGADQEGFSLWQVTIRNGKRCSAATAYLRPAHKRRNLEIRTGVLAHRILLQGKRAIGVEFSHGNSLHHARATRETLISAGSINTPQLLMLSGIGDPDELRQHQIECQHKLPGVGKNLQDHVSSHVSFTRKDTGTLHRAMRIDRIGRELGKSYFFGRGIASEVPGGPMAFLKSDTSEPIPDVQLLFIAAPMTAAPYLRPFTTPYQDGFAVRPVVLRPQSRGSIALRSNDPRDPVRIRQNFLASSTDRLKLRAGLRMANEIANRKALSRFVKSPVEPRGNAWADAQLDEHIAATALTVNHPAGTCKMGRPTDSMAVVDPDCHVIGIDGLRVVDASVMPDLVGGNINAPVIMIAEKVAQRIRTPQQASI